MPYMDFTKTPSYQRMMQKLQSIRPEQRAVLNTLSMDAQFADEATRRTLAAMAQSQNKEYADKSLDLRSRAQASTMGLRRREFDFNQDQNKMATGLGIGQVLAEADYGKRRDALDIETFKQKKAFADRLAQYYGGNT